MIIGDVLLDRDVVGRVERICQDAPVPVLDVVEAGDRPGGAGQAALLAASDGHEVTLVSAVAEDDAGWRLRELFADAGVTLCTIGYRGSTPEKIRLGASGQLLLRVDVGGRGTYGRVPNSVPRLLRAASAVLVSDYGYGITGLPALRGMIAEQEGRAPLVWDPHPRGAPPVRGATMATPNHGEAARFAGGASCGPGLSCVARHAEELARRWLVEAVTVTLGADGALLWYADAAAQVPPPFVAAGDNCGAGDRFAAAVVGALSTGASPPDAVEAAVTTATAYVASGGPRGLGRVGRPATTAVLPIAVASGGAGQSDGAIA